MEREKQIPALFLSLTSSLLQDEGWVPRDGNLTAGQISCVGCAPACYEWEMTDRGQQLQGIRTLPALSAWIIVTCR